MEDSKRSKKEKKEKKEKKSSQNEESNVNPDDHKVMSEMVSTMKDLSVGSVSTVNQIQIDDLGPYKNVNRSERSTSSIWYSNWSQQRLSNKQLSNQVTISDLLSALNLKKSQLTR